MPQGIRIWSRETHESGSTVDAGPRLVHRRPRVRANRFELTHEQTLSADREVPLDINARIVAVAKRNLENSGMRADLKQGNVEQLPYEDEYFDAVISTMALSGYPDGASAMSEIRRVLQPGGRFILIDVNYPADHDWLGVRLISVWQRLV